MKYIENCSLNEKKITIDTQELKSIVFHHLTDLKPLLSFNFKSTRVLQRYQLTPRY